MQPDVFETTAGRDYDPGRAARRVPITPEALRGVALGWVAAALVYVALGVPALAGTVAAWLVGLRLLAVLLAVPALVGVGLGVMSLALTVWMPSHYAERDPGRAVDAPFWYGLSSGLIFGFAVALTGLTLLYTVAVPIAIAVAQAK